MYSYVQNSLLIFFQACKILTNRYHELEELLRSTEDIQHKVILYCESAVIIAMYGQFE